ncbi:hypothetical protein QOZ80_1BG0055810 [Eleusine coracana subsp. coracana]|nr:hypothetical protein QOZ80_1BG0055810 [Eleusine coracana subsp. coracana]
MMDDVVLPAEAEPTTSRRNWGDLPRDIGYEIFCRIPHRDILESAGLVCASWRRLAVEEPILWRHIDIAFDWKEYWVKGLNEEFLKTPARPLAMARAAVDRSAGRCESFRGPVDGPFLLHLATNAPSLRRLHVTSFFRLDKGLVGRVVPKMTLLERLVLDAGLAIGTTLLAFLDHCPHLQLLDAGGCYMETRCSSTLLASLSLVKVLVLPREELPIHREPTYLCMEEWDYYYWEDEEEAHTSA